VVAALAEIVLTGSSMESAAPDPMGVELEIAAVQRAG